MNVFLEALKISGSAVLCDTETLIGKYTLIWHLNGICRKRLFQMINDLPTIYEVVTGSVKQSKDHSGAQNNGSKSKSSSKMVSQFQLHGLIFFVYGSWKF